MFSRIAGFARQAVVAGGRRRLVLAVVAPTAAAALTSAPTVCEPAHLKRSRTFFEGPKVLFTPEQQEEIAEEIGETVVVAAMPTAIKDALIEQIVAAAAIVLSELDVETRESLKSGAVSSALNSRLTQQVFQMLNFPLLSREAKFNVTTTVTAREVEDITITSAAIQLLAPRFERAIREFCVAASIEPGAPLDEAASRDLLLASLKAVVPQFERLLPIDLVHQLIGADAADLDAVKELVVKQLIRETALPDTIPSEAREAALHEAVGILCECVFANNAVDDLKDQKSSMARIHKRKQADLAHRLSNLADHKQQTRVRVSRVKFMEREAKKQELPDSSWNPFGHKSTA
ncbi:hypothetical protein EMIHUDRAFT_120889 [Emiliania huxleyi CCMP1516]|uniref:Trigger factor C-terminal domain-containing protein n=2 Tax=Emiliania huxleyi TaxID=2903 RepID=A0A0D3IB34_EMIH1|nr:hypothetical protein EMIHUDRAFT_120889 [Emiliania huxleyi CCMP1516]EOD08469.1 hypothetical protein EMIHUDRAFT_120889 [Emiliania huxleyi CCMP1516]|eukprot:XP_005760898.1 hypothetical protein EMIHUDRAFT_120889 [Emiliania huxleyi CCMP1516]